MRQLVANIERNRMKIRKDLLETRGADQLSHGRRVAIASIKERIDDQARLLEQEERVLKEKGDYYRRKEDRLRILRQKLDIIKGQDKLGEDISDDQREGLIKEVQVDFDKYLQLFQNHKKAKTVTKKVQEEVSSLEGKWAAYLGDQASLEPISFLDQDRGAVARPYTPSAVVSSITSSVYERELKRIKTSRHAMQQFIDTQQRWLTKMRHEVGRMSVHQHF